MIDKLCEECRGLGLCICIKKNYEWISVEAILPEECSSVLLFDEIQARVVGYLEDQKFYIYAKHGESQPKTLSHVTHWMPLPDCP